MITLSKKYMIDLIGCFFAPTILVTIFACTATALADSENYFCNLFLNVTESSSFSFESLLHLKGFTYQSPNELMMIAGDFQYKFDPKNLPNNTESISIGKQNYDRLLSKSLPNEKLGISDSSGEHLEMLYRVVINNPVSNTGSMYLAITNSQEICFEMDTQNGIFSVARNSFNAAFAFVQDQVNQTDMRTYVISKVPGEKKKALIIYPLKFEYEYNKCFMEVVNGDNLMRSNNYYYLQRTNDPKTVRLMKGKPENEQKSELYPLAQRPTPGFMLHGKLYLFDIDLGCVYIITDWARRDLKKEFEKNSDEIIVKRRNVPFESFFRCDANQMDKFSFLYQDRCETTIDSNGTKILLKDFPAKWNFVGFSCIGICIICILCGCAYLIMSRMKQKKEGSGETAKSKNKSLVGSVKKQSLVSKSRKSTATTSTGTSSTTKA